MESKISIKNHINTVRELSEKRRRLKTKAKLKSYLFWQSLKTQKIIETFTSPSTGMEFVLIPAGEFDMGSLSEEKDRSDYESPVHKVTIKNSFYLGKSSVTQKQWKKIMGNNPSHFKGEDRPVEMVSWKEVQEFVHKTECKRRH